MPPAVANADAIVANVVANPPEMKNVTLPASHPVVAKTTFLGFSDAPAADGVAQKSLSNGQMLRAFGRRCKLSQARLPPGWNLRARSLHPRGHTGDRQSAGPR